MLTLRLCWWSPTTIVNSTRTEGILAHSFSCEALGFHFRETRWEACSGQESAFSCASSERVVDIREDAHDQRSLDSMRDCLLQKAVIKQISMKWRATCGLLACLALSDLATAAGYTEPTASRQRQYVTSADDISAVTSLLEPGEDAVLFFDASSDRCATLHLHITTRRNGVLGCVHAFVLTLKLVVTAPHTLTHVFAEHTERILPDCITK